ncbi:MAG: response regulator [Promethearchaeota archaeon]
MISEENARTELMEKYEKETGKKAIWHGNITEGFKKWKKGEKVYVDKRERISILIDEKDKNEWQDFARENNIITLSKLIRESVNFYMDFKKKLPQFENLSNITFNLKEPLTTIKGFSELLMQDYKHELSWDVLLKIRSIFEKSVDLEERINSMDFKQLYRKDQYDILIVDDDEYTIQLLTDILETKGYKCEKATTGKEALELLEKTTPKIILLDIILPDISGYEICKVIKTRKELIKTPVYYITAVSPNEVKNKISDTGADGFFLKPFKLTDFNVLENYL